VPRFMDTSLSGVCVFLDETSLLSLRAVGSP
jgi:hypothetical protein